MKTIILALSCFLYTNTVNGNPDPHIPDKTIIILSPHPDDGPLTFGGMLQNNQGFVDQRKSISIYEPWNMTNYTESGGFNIFTNNRIGEVTSLRLHEDYTAYNQLFQFWDRYHFFGKLYPEFTLRRYIAKEDTNLFVRGEECSILNGSIYSSEMKMQQGASERRVYKREAHTQATSNDAASSFPMSIKYENKFSTEDLVYYQKVYNDLIKLLNQKSCAAFVLSAVGNSRFVPHPDHILLREATIQAVHDLSQHQPLNMICQIYFGEDQPYTNSDLTMSLKNIANFRKRMHNTDKKYMIEYKIDKEKKWNLFETSYKSQNGESYKYAILQRDTESIYFWPKSQYSQVTTNIKMVK